MNQTSDNLLLSALPQSLLVVSADMEITYLNQSAEDLLGHSAAYFIGKKLSEVVVFGSEWLELCERVIKTGNSISLFSQKLELFHETISLTVHLVLLGNGSVMISLERQDGIHKLAGKLAKNEAMRASSLMAAMLSHEVKNPLSGIRGAAQLLQAEVTEEQKSLAELICNEADRIRDLLNVMEVFTTENKGGTQVGEPVKSAINIHEVLQYVIAIAKNGFAAKVIFRELYDPSLPEVFSNRDLLVQVFLNLIKNSAEAVAEIPNPTVTISSYYQTGYKLDGLSLPIAIDIADNGTGIAEHLRDNLFEPFLSSKEQGRGLGLAIVAKITSDLGASIELDEKTMVGTKFTVRLPIIK